MKTFALQPLRIPSGWLVEYNRLTEYELKDGPEYKDLLRADLLQLKRGKILIFLGWYPATDPQGAYVLYKLDLNNPEPFKKPLDVFESKVKQEITDKIEQWTNEPK